MVTGTENNSTCGFSGCKAVRKLRYTEATRECSSICVHNVVQFHASVYAWMSPEGAKAEFTLNWPLYCGYQCKLEQWLI